MLKQRSRRKHPLIRGQARTRARFAGQTALKRRVRHAVLSDRGRPIHVAGCSKQARTRATFPHRARTAIGPQCARKVFGLPIGAYLFLALAALALLLGSLNVASAARTAAAQTPTGSRAEIEFAALALTTAQPGQRDGRDPVPAAAGFGPDGGSTIPPAININVDSLLASTRSVVLVRTESGTGTGFVVAPYRLLTAEHVVDDTEEVEIVLPSGATYRAFVAWRNVLLDVAVLIAPGLPLDTPVLRLGTTAAHVGSPVYAIGYPHARLLERTGYSTAPSVSVGIVSATRINGQRAILETDAAINAGNSGGPLLSADGIVIGVVVSEVKFRSVTVEGLNFALDTTKHRETIMKMVAEAEQWIAPLRDVLESRDGG